MNSRYRAISLLVVLLVASGCMIGQEPITPQTPSESQETPIHEQPAHTPKLPKTPSAQDDISAADLEQQIHLGINEVRRQNGLRPLVHDNRLSAIGRYHSWDMAMEGYFGHTEPSGRSPSEVREQYHYKCTSIGQNIYYISFNASHSFVEEKLSDTSALADRIVRGWMDSPGHRDNILSPYYVAHGIGVFVTKNGTIYVTQELCG